VYLTVLPFAPLPVGAALVAFARLRQGTAASGLEIAVYVAGGLVIALVMLCQATVTRELVAAAVDRPDLDAAHKQLEAIAITDALTGLPNRTLLLDRLGQAVRTAQRTHQPLALLVMNLDRFKEINTALGHDCGDVVLQQIGPRVRSVLRDSDTVARIGGDEFAMLLPDADEEGALRVAHVILGALDTSFQVQGQAVDVDASLGVALYPAHGTDMQTLLRCVEVAMYDAKRTRNGVTLYDQALDQHSAPRLTLMSDLRAALMSETLQLHYQPKIDRSTGRAVGAEVLLRWPHPELGMIPPDKFIPLAEHSGIIVPLTAWVLEKALQQGQAWRQQQRDLNLSVNLSPRLLHDIEFPALVEELLKRYDYPPACLTLEITESALILDPERALSVLLRLSQLGVRISIDDFGTGYSNLGYLQQLPVDEVKIDKSFVIGMDTEQKETSLVRSIIAMAHALNMTVVAEGVETAGVWDLLQHLECDSAQGFYMSRPVPAEALEQWMVQSPWGSTVAPMPALATA